MASSIALSTKYPFAMFGLFWSMSMSFRAARIVAANRMANFLSSVTLELGSRSLSFVFPFAEPMGEPMRQTVEGLWWKRDPGVSGFVALSNVTDTDTQASVELVGPGNSAQAERIIALPAHSTWMLHLEDLADNPSPLAKRVGGIRVQYSGQPGSVQVTGGLENDAEGYSANIPFWGHDMSSASPGQITYASAGLMVGKPDPMMMHGFPKETTFSPYLVLRNTAEKPLEVSLQLNYMMGMDGSAPVTRNLPPQHLGPFEARQVDMQTALNSSGLKGFNGSINLSTSFTGKAGDLVLATGSVDQTGSYVFEVEPESVGNFRSKNANYWGVANGNDTMFTLWNPTGSAQDILVTFYYGDGSGKYDLPVHLGPQASTMIDMAMLIAENKPDSDGNVIPSSIQEGSAQFASAKGRTETISLIIAAGIYNVSNATCGGGCINCCGGSNFGISPNPIFCPIGESMQCTSTAVDCNGYSFGPSSWSSDNSSVMTVNGSGAVTGVSVGQANIIATYLGAGVYTGQMCGGNGCPSASPAPRAPATVQKPGYVKVVSAPTDPTVCLGLGCEVDITYRVLDTNRQPMNIAGMTVTESMSGTTTCSNGTIVDSGQWTTDSTGTLTAPDVIYFCCLQGANCRLSMDQYFTVNGQSVLVMGADGLTTGIKNTITINCTNGQASCPGILIN